jgi:hypothetical protein
MMIRLAATERAEGEQGQKFEWIHE